MPIYGDRRVHGLEKATEEDRQKACDIWGNPLDYYAIKACEFNNVKYHEVSPAMRQHAKMRVIGGYYGGQQRRPRPNPNHGFPYGFNSSQP